MLWCTARFGSCLFQVGSERRNESTMIAKTRVPKIEGADMRSMYIRYVLVIQAEVLRSGICNIICIYVNPKTMTEATLFNNQLSTLYNCSIKNNLNALNLDHNKHNKHKYMLVCNIIRAFVVLFFFINNSNYFSNNGSTL